MHAKLSLLLIAAATIVAAGDPGVGSWDSTTKKCNVGKLQCCNQVQKATDSNASKQLGLIGVAVGTVKGLVGLDCNPISVIGVGGNNCAAQPVCCSKNSFGGVVALGCTPVNVNL